MFLLPFRKSEAAENMRIDIAMLCANAPFGNSPRLRFYGWRGDCFSCGTSQNIDDVKQTIAPQATLVKRPSGGGIVDHRNDLTYALAVPRGLPLAEIKAVDSYKQTHYAIAQALRELDVDAFLCTPEHVAAHKKIYACFASPSLFDVMIGDGQKVAGAAQKRNKFGILFQGSVDISKLPQTSSANLQKKIAQKFAELLGEEIEEIDFPEF